LEDIKNQSQNVFDDSFEVPSEEIPQTEPEGLLEIQSLRKEIASLRFTRISEGFIHNEQDEFDTAKRHSNRLSVLLQDEQRRLSNRWSQYVNSESARRYVELIRSSHVPSEAGQWDSGSERTSYTILSDIVTKGRDLQPNLPTSAEDSPISPVLWSKRALEEGEPTFEGSAPQSPPIFRDFWLWLDGLNERDFKTVFGRLMLRFGPDERNMQKTDIQEDIPSIQRTPTQDSFIKSELAHQQNGTSMRRSTSSRDGQYHVFGEELSTQASIFSKLGHNRAASTGSLAPQESRKPRKFSNPLHHRNPMESLNLTMPRPYDNAFEAFDFTEPSRNGISARDSAENSSIVPQNFQEKALFDAKPLDDGSTALLLEEIDRSWVKDFAVFRNEVQLTPLHHTTSEIPKGLAMKSFSIHHMKQWGVTRDASCETVLSMATGHYGLSNDWQYTLWVRVSTDSNESNRILSLDEQPMRIYETLAAGGQTAVFCLKRRTDLI
jgi:Ras association (RalGDS/AF-6) domain